MERLQMLYMDKFIDDVREISEGDGSLCFKLLGLVVDVTEEGAGRLLSGEFISPHTYYRWMELIDRA